MKHYTDDDLIDYLHGELAETDDVRVHVHLAQCTDCRSRYEAEASLGDMLRSSALAEEREFPASIRAQVYASVRAAKPTLLERIRAVISPLVAVPLAAALALLMYLGVPVLRGSHATAPPTVSALYYLEEHAAQGQETPLADHLNTNATLATQPAPSLANAPLIDAADAATLDDVVATRK